MSLLPRIVLLILPAVVLALAPPLFTVQYDAIAGLDDVRVPVLLGVTSRGPDALLCEAVFDQVLNRVIGITDLKLIYVGQLNPSEPDFGVECLHGPDECAGNVQQLCVAKYTNPTDWWSFVHCQNYQGRDRIGTPDVALNCAKIAGIDWEGGGAGDCAGLDGSGRGSEGVSLLQESVRATEALGIDKSCTILINGRQVCIHDRVWKECQAGHNPGDFVRQINHEYERLNGDDYSGE
ncbi:hypothetical protein PILCRDRAFT_811268 [Piloderma croceum F 1598]|uniref:Gamma interferon inducible lysosomal thiol reductase GILT n=1 Tax=Piloderma croceum (strain F 1598) TaxID=765440 RepID=A0A0C3GGK9_PILCF|nr:hypothetical protein PILCRDRAFT_811268 [Piloderma croceum F 1598]